jgi:hypothetical protein
MRPAIVYCGTRADTDAVADELTALGIPTRPYHAGMTAGRDEAQEAFMRGEVEVITATVAFGMGIDKADVRSVWHWAIPTSLEGYYQEAGRAGRDGQPARAVLLSMRADLGRLQRIIERKSGAARSAAWEGYHAIVSLSEDEGCRRARILRHFGDAEPPAPTVRCCDVCEPPEWLEAAALSAPSRVVSGRGAVPQIELNAEDELLFEQLRGWRRSGPTASRPTRCAPTSRCGRWPRGGPPPATSCPPSRASARASSRRTRRRSSTWSPGGPGWLPGARTRGG